MKVRKLSNRRDFLKVSVLGGASAAILAACGQAPAPAATTAPAAATQAPAAKPTEAPKPAATTAPAAASPTAAAAKPTEAAKPTVAAAKAPSGEKTTIRYGTFWPAYRVEILNQGLGVFKQQNPNIDVSIETLDASQYRDKLAVNMAAGTTQDSFIIDVWTSARYFDQNLMLELTDRFKTDGIVIKDQYSTIGLENWCGKQFVIPFVLSPHAYYYNKTMLKANGAPDPWDDLKGEWTWADMVTIGKAVSGKKNKQNQPMWGYRIGYNALEYQLSPFVQSNGGKVYDLEQKKYTMDEPKAIEAIKFVYDMVVTHKIVLPLSESTTLNQAGIAAPFAAGITAMEEDSTGRIYFNAQTIKNDFEWDIAPIPAAQKGGKGISHMDGDPNAVFVKTPKADQAYTWIKFLGGKDFQTILSKNKLLLPALNSAAADPEGFLKPPPNHLDVFVKAAKENAIPSFYQYNGLEAGRIFTAALENAFLGKIPVEDAMKNATKEANAKVELGNCKQSPPRVG